MLFALLQHHGSIQQHMQCPPRQGTQNPRATPPGKGATASDVDRTRAKSLRREPLGKGLKASDVDGVAEQARHLAFRARREPVAADDVEGDERCEGLDQMLHSPVRHLQPQKENWWPLNSECKSWQLGNSQAKKVAKVAVESYRRITDLEPSWEMISTTQRFRHVMQISNIDPLSGTYHV